MSTLPKSLLTEVIEKLPDDWAINPASAKNYLLKQGVKEDELKWSGFDWLLSGRSYAPDSTPERILNINSKRIYENPTGQRDAWIGQGLLDRPDNALFTEFGRTQQEVEGRLSAHDYFAKRQLEGRESKITKEDLRQINALRPDYFSQKVRSGMDTAYDSTILNNTDTSTYKEKIRTFSDDSAAYRRVQSHFNEKEYLFHSRVSEAKVNDLDTLVVQEIQSDLHQAGRMDGYTAPSGSRPKSPLEKNWHIKAIEQELIDAAAAGKEAIAIPLEGAQGQLYRGSGVQKWYETTVRNTLQKIAKRIGGKYQETFAESYYRLPDNFTTDDLENAVINNQAADNQIRHQYIKYLNETQADSRTGMTDEDVTRELADYFTLSEGLDWVQQKTPEEVRELIPALSGKPYGITYTPGGTNSIREAIDNNREAKRQAIDVLGKLVRIPAYYSQYNMLGPEITKALLDPTQHARLLDEKVNHALSIFLSRAYEKDPKYFETTLKGSHPLISAAKPGGINFGQIVLPSTGKGGVSLKWDKPPQTIEELRKFENEFPIEYDQLMNEINDYQLGMSGFTGRLAEPLSDTVDPSSPSRSLLLSYMNNHWTDIDRPVWDNISMAMDLPRKVSTPEKAELPEWAKSLALYSSAGAAVISDTDPVEASDFSDNPVMKALNAGYNIAELEDYLVNNDIHPDEETAHDSILVTLNNLITQAQQSTDDDTIRQYLQSEYQLDEETIEEAFNYRKEYIPNADGSFSSEKTISFEENGKEIVIPTIVKGIQLSEDDAIAAYHDGMNPSIAEYDTVEEANTAAQQRSDFLGNREQPGPRTGKLIPLGSPDKKYTDEEITDFYAAGNQIYDRMSNLYKLIKAGITEDPKIQEEYAKAEYEYNTHIANGLRGLGIDIQFNEDLELAYKNEEGEMQPIDAGFFDHLYASKLEATLAIGGAYGGYQVVKNLTALAKAGKNVPLISTALNFAGSVAGSAIGAAGGRGIDTMFNSFMLKQELDKDFYFETMQDAGVADATFNIIGTPIFMLGAGAVKLVGKGFKAFLDGNTSGAYRALKDHLQLSDEQVGAIIKEWETITGNKAPGLTQTKKALYVIPQTVPGAEEIISKSVAFDPAMSSRLTYSIAKRAEQLNKLSSELTADNIGSVVKEDLRLYTDTVKSFYKGIKDFGINSFTDKSYRFNYQELTIDPVLDSIESSIKNPKILDRFHFYLKKIRELGGSKVPTDPADMLIQLPEGVAMPDYRLRTFKDLMDLRQTINDFRFNVKIPNAADRAAIDNVIKKIDTEIRSAATEYIPNGDEWLKQWKKANVEYSKMKKVESNVLYKAINRPGVTKDQITKAFNKYILSLDSTFIEVMGKLPPNIRRQAEGAVIDTLTKKNTFGKELQAVDFPTLADSLGHISFASAEARKLKQTISMLAKVFRNDVALQQATGAIHPARQSTYLSKDITARVHYQVISELFNYLKRLLPTEQGRTTALIMKVAHILKQPTNDKAISSLMKEVKNDPAMENALKQLAITHAKFGERDILPYVEVYRAGVPGSFYKQVDGKYGKGIYWTTDKTKAYSRNAAIKGKVLTEKVLPPRIAGKSDVEQLLGITDFDPKMMKKDPFIAKQLKDVGNYNGIAVDDEVFIFGD